MTRVQQSQVNEPAAQRTCFVRPRRATWARRNCGAQHPQERVPLSPLPQPARVITCRYLLLGTVDKGRTSPPAPQPPPPPLSSCPAPLSAVQRTHARTPGLSLTDKHTCMLSGTHAKTNTQYTEAHKTTFSKVIAMPEQPLARYWEVANPSQSRLSLCSFP